MMRLTTNWFTFDSVALGSLFKNLGINDASDKGLIRDVSFQPVSNACV